jgi:hypothetical protein
MALYTKKEAAKVMRVCVSTLDLYTLRGFLKPVRRGYRVMFVAAEVDKLAECPLPPVWPAKKQADPVTGRLRNVRIAGVEPSDIARRSKAKCAAHPARRAFRLNPDGTGLCRECYEARRAELEASFRLLPGDSIHAAQGRGESRPVAAAPLPGANELA